MCHSGPLCCFDVLPVLTVVPGIKATVVGGYMLWSWYATHKRYTAMKRHPLPSKRKACAGGEVPAAQQLQRVPGIASCCNYRPTLHSQKLQAKSLARQM